MGLLQRILEYDRTVAQGLPGPVPVTGGRKVVCVVCPEVLTGAAGGGVAARLGLQTDDVVLLVVPAARVGRPDSEVSRGAALLAAQAGSADVLVAGHAGCAFRAPTFSLPGPSTAGDAPASDEDVVAASVANLRGASWMPRGVTVDGLLIERGGRLRGIAGSAVASDAPGASAPASPGSFATPGPVSFFGGGPAPSLAAPPPAILAGAVPFDVPPPQMPTIDLSGPAPTYAAHVLPPLAPPTPPSALTRPPDLVRPPELVRPPALSDILERPAPDAPPPPPPPPPEPPRAERSRFDVSPSERPRRAQVPPPPPRAAPPRESESESAPKPSADDPFTRAEEILERLRRERGKRR